MPKAWVYGDNVDTDVIIPARYLTTADPGDLGAHALEDLDPTFASAVSAGDVIFAGANFGCGSSREHAPIALQGAGVGAVVAKSFARIFFRNAINMGLPIFVCPEAVDATSQGQLVVIDLATGTITNETLGSSFRAEELPEFVMDIVRAGGLIEWVRSREVA